MERDVLAELYAPFGLSIRVGDITLRMFRDADLPAYADLINSSLFQDETAPHVFAWWARDLADKLLDSLQFQWSARASIKPSAWTLMLGVFEGGRLIGSQDIGAKDFVNLRVVNSGSYLRLDAQGRGVGTLMRQMMLTFAFDHLGATRAESGAVVGNAASLAVSRKAGYQLDGLEVTTNGDSRVEIQRVAVTPATFIRPEADVVVEGLTPRLRHMLGADLVV